MGQAWIIESLIFAAKNLNIPSLNSYTNDFFQLFRWDSYYSFWDRCSVDGQDLTPDLTFNHQLWFCAVSAQLSDTSINEKCKSFLDNCASEVQIYSNGIIKHASRLGKLKFNPFCGRSYLKRELTSLLLSKSLFSKSVGYHSLTYTHLVYLKKRFQTTLFGSHLSLRRSYQSRKKFGLKRFYLIHHILGLIIHQVSS